MDDNKELVRRIAATFAGYHPHKDGWEAYIDEAEDVLSIIQPELDKRDARIAELTDALFDMVWQHCSNGEKISDDCLSSNEGAFSILGLEDGMIYDECITALKTTTGHDNNTEKRGKR